VPKQPTPRHSRQIPRSALNDTPTPRLRRVGVGLSVVDWFCEIPRGHGAKSLTPKASQKRAWAASPYTHNASIGEHGRKPTHAKLSISGHGRRPIHAKRVIQSRRRGICLEFTLRYGLTAYSGRRIGRVGWAKKEKAALLLRPPEYFIGADKLSLI
jgi:hypothetical protein